MDEAMNEIRWAQRLDPLSLIINARVGITFYYYRRYDEAIAELKRTLEFNPDFVLTHIFLYASLFEKGAYREAIPHIVKGFFNDLPPGEKARIDAALRTSFNTSGQKGLWTKVRDLLKVTDSTDFNYAYSMAETNMRIGDKDEAFLWLNRAADLKHPGVGALRVEPAMDPLRSDPRFAELLGRVNLPQ
jgi:tetratricopeptide (TPR) repeat protein